MNRFNETSNRRSNIQPSVDEQNNNSQQIKLSTSAEAKENEQPSTGRAIANQQYPFPLNSNYFAKPNPNGRQNEKQAKYYPAYNHRNTYDPPKPVGKYRGRFLKSIFRLDFYVFCFQVKTDIHSRTWR
jgi:hypothetical protein